MPDTPELPDDAFLEAWEACTLPAEQWTHRAHLRAAYLLLLRDGTDATRTMPERIKAYNAAIGVKEAIDMGYHETLTQAWLRVVHNAAREHLAQRATTAEFLADNPALFNKRLLLEFYSRQRIMSAEAKAQFIEPDLGPLPTTI